MRSDWSKLAPDRACELFEEFRASVPDRIEDVRRRTTSIDPSWEDTKDEASCVGMIRALATVTVTVVRLRTSRKPPTDEKLLAFPNGKAARVYTDDDKFHVESASRDALINAGGYMSDCLIRHFPGLGWSMLFDTKSVDHQRPFVMTGQRNGTAFDPTGVLGHLTFAIRIGSLDLLESWVEERFEFAGLSVRGCSPAEFNAVSQKYVDRNAPTMLRWAEDRERAKKTRDTAN